MGGRRIVLVRHGQTDFNVERRFQGRADQPLNERGMAQAHAAAGVLATRLSGPGEQVGVNADSGARTGGGARLICSPLLRARMTARILADVFEAVGRPLDGPFVDERLTERDFGRMEGHTFAELVELYPAQVAQWRACGECPEAGVEPSGAVGRRMRDAVLEAEGQCRDGQTLLVVSHGSAIARGITSLLGLDPDAFDGLRGVDNCHWSELVPIAHAKRRGTVSLGWRLAAHNVGVREDVLGA